MDLLQLLWYFFVAEDLCDEFVLDSDDEEEVYQCEEEPDIGDVDEDDRAQGDDEGFEAEDEDAECPDTPVVDKIDPELQYEICQTTLGDCGCVTGPSPVKSRCV
jgi:hypothetical protein